MKFKVGDIVLAVRKDKWQADTTAVPFSSGTYNLKYFLHYSPLGLGKIIAFVGDDLDDIIVVHPLTLEEDSGYFFSESELVLIERKND
jgi:hypothetical protein